MAGFELARIGTVAEVAREWKIGKYVPLYLAGIAAGAAIGLGLTHIGASSPNTDTGHSHTAAVVAPVTGSDISPKTVAVTSGASELLPSGAAIPNALTIQLPASMEDLFNGHGPAASVVAPPAAAPAADAPAGGPQLVITQVQPPPPSPAAPVEAQAPSAPAAAPAAAPATTGKPDFYVPPVSAAGPSVLEEQLFAGLNAQRADAGLAPYAYDAGLTKIARTRSQQMVDQNYFAHVDPAGNTMYTALLAYFGYTSYNWAGENLALNNYGASDTVSEAITALMASPTHRANILATDFYRVGIGESDTADGRHIYTMIFLG